MGRPKGTLLREGEPLIERALRIGTEVGLTPVLVGDASPYGHLARGVPRVADDPPGIGPLGGLRALLRRGTPAIALACDMPYVDAEVLRRLVAAPVAPLVAPRGSHWEPLCARYGAEALPVVERAVTAGEHSLQRLFARLEVIELPIPDRLLRDWDRPEDVE